MRAQCDTVLGSLLAQGLEDAQGTSDGCRRDELGAPRRVEVPRVPTLDLVHEADLAKVVVQFNRDIGPSR